MKDERRQEIIKEESGRKKSDKKVSRCGVTTDPVLLSYPLCPTSNCIDRLQSCNCTLTILTIMVCSVYLCTLTQCVCVCVLLCMCSAQYETYGIWFVMRLTQQNFARERTYYAECGRCPYRAIPTHI